MAAIDADHVEARAGEAAAVKVGEDALPFGGALAASWGRVSTVKTHLGRLYKKTGARRQADLVKLVTGFSSPLLG